MTTLGMSEDKGDEKLSRDRGEEELAKLAPAPAYFVLDEGLGDGEAECSGERRRFLRCQ